MKRKYGSKLRYWRSVFRRVMSKYDEIKTTYDQHSCEAFYRQLQSEAMSFGGFNSKVIQVSPVDFICDVELAAKAALSEVEWDFFKKVYLHKIEVPESLASNPNFPMWKHRIQEKVGKMLAYRKIYPVAEYFKPIDLR